MPDGYSVSFPRLFGSRSVLTSDVTERYNCIAWAAGDATRWWWPDPDFESFWPIERREETLVAFEEAFASLGYEPCADGSVEDGFEKVVIWALSGLPTHAARQLRSGAWTSKLGAWVDIEHAIEALEGPVYGAPERFLRRARTEDESAADRP